MKISSYKINGERGEVAARLQAGLVWPAFDTTVTGWGMDIGQACGEGQGAGGKSRH